MNYQSFFKHATGFSPYHYQCKLACGPNASADDAKSLTSHNQCRSLLINIPTGLGKTAAVVIAWLWNRLTQPEVSKPKPQIPNPESKTPDNNALSIIWPRRLVYCLPMRTLVEQTAEEVSKWLRNLRDAAISGQLDLAESALAELLWLAGTDGLSESQIQKFKSQIHAELGGPHSPIILMGGEELDPSRRDWDLYPEKPAILIGTQDMLLSRALNRGYAMSRYRWPIHFALLNNDCLWVMDETQLMGSGLATACQLEAFREPVPRGFYSYGPASATWYMSATNSLENLKTREWRKIQRPQNFKFELTEEDYSAMSDEVHKRRFAVKQVELQQDWSFINATIEKNIVSQVLKRHKAMLQAVSGNFHIPARTLIICNTVDRAKNLYALLAKDKPCGCDLLLLHSHFRPPERKSQMKRLQCPDLKAFPDGQIVVSTQVIEAGVDISSGVLWSEIAPLASLVQRLGRLNRYGEFNDSSWTPVAVIVGLGIEPPSEKEKKEDAEKRKANNRTRCLPYEIQACESAWQSLEKIKNNASPAGLQGIDDDIAKSIPRCPYSLQRHELLDFFDTDSNLSLGFTDVSPFVRGLDYDTDLHVLWRQPWVQDNGEIGTERPGFTPDFQYNELCPVPISNARAAQDNILNQGWIWRGKDAGWISVREAGLFPGMTILLPLQAGGYDNAIGWTGNKADNKHLSHYQPNSIKSDEEKLSCLTSGWRSIPDHTNEVVKELYDLINNLQMDAVRKNEFNALIKAATWHDIGKNHPKWQEAVLNSLNNAGIKGKDKFRPFAKFSLSDSPQLHNKHGDEFESEIRKLRNSFRPGITHEVASALAFRQFEQKHMGLARDTDFASLLAEYVIMSHHGRVRKVLRDEIPRFPNNQKDINTVRGVSNGDMIPSIEISGTACGCDAISTDCRKMGRGPNGHESYTRGILRLLEYYGPFRLAFFEVLFRAADIRASIKASQELNE